MGDKRITALGLWRYGSDYLQAAFAVQKQPGNIFDEMHGKNVSMPAYYLIGHSIELSIKGFLRARGVSIKSLSSRKYGHDLQALIKEARKRKLGNEVKLSNNEIDAIMQLNKAYKNKEFEYIYPGLVTLPTYGRISKVAIKLSDGLKDICHRKTLFAKRKA